jgi:hypothetical protein
MLEALAPKVMSIVHEGERLLYSTARQVLEANNLYLVKAHILLEETLDAHV